MPRSRVVIGYNTLAMLEALLSPAEIVVPRWADADRAADAQNRRQRVTRCVSAHYRFIRDLCFEFKAKYLADAVIERRGRSSTWQAAPVTCIRPMVSSARRMARQRIAFERFVDDFISRWVARPRRPREVGGTEHHAVIASASAQCSLASLRHHQRCGTGPRRRITAPSSNEAGALGIRVLDTAALYGRARRCSARACRARRSVRHHHQDVEVRGG